LAFLTDLAIVLIDVFKRGFTMNTTLRFPRVKGYILLMSADEARLLEPNPPGLAKAFDADSVCTWIYSDGGWQTSEEVDVSIEASNDSRLVSISYAKIASPSELARAVTLANGMDYKLGQLATKNTDSASELIEFLDRQAKLLNEFDAEQRLANAPKSLFERLATWFTTQPDNHLLVKPWIVLLVTLPKDAAVKLDEKSTFPGIYSSWSLRPES
jgi:hypothetical protein